MNDKLTAADVTDYLEKRIPELAYAIRDFHSDHVHDRTRAKTIASTMLRDIRNFLAQPVCDIPPDGWYFKLDHVVAELDELDEYIENAERYAQHEAFRDYYENLIKSLGFIRKCTIGDPHKEAIFTARWKTEKSWPALDLEFNGVETNGENLRKELERYAKATGRKLPNRSRKKSNR